MRIVQKRIYDWKDIESNMDNIRETILDKYRNKLVVESCWDSELKFKRKIRIFKLGYRDIEIHHSNIFGSTEGGVIITGGLELNKEVLNRLGIEVDFIRAHLISKHIGVVITPKGELFTNSSALVNSATKFIGDVEIDNWLEETALKIRDAVGEEIVNLSKGFLKSLTNYHDYLTSDKKIINYFKVNKIELYKNGEVYEDEQNKPIRSIESLEELCDWDWEEIYERSDF